jgi:hypothetical protein
LQVAFASGRVGMAGWAGMAGGMQPDNMAVAVNKRIKERYFSMRSHP